MKIAIFRKDIGNYSETFVQRNIACLNGGETVVIGARLVDDPGWTPKTPTLLLAQYPSALRRLAVRLFLKRHRVGGAVCEFLDYATVWAPLLHEARIPFVCLGHGFDIGRIPRGRNNFVPALPSLRNGCKILVPCDYAKTILLRRARFDPDFIESIPVGIDLGAFQKPGLQREGNRFVFVGRFVEKKSPVCLIMAFHHALARVPGLRLDCVGDGPLLPAAKQLVRCLGIESHVFFHGAKPHREVIVMLKEARAIIQHSVTGENGDMETMPLSVQEALACGTPAVVTDHAGLPDIVTEGKSGYLVPEFDYHAMGDRIARMATLPAADYRAMQDYALRDSARFDYRFRVGRIEALLARKTF